MMTEPRRVPRGIRNNNPGNIKRGQPWKGLSTAQAVLDDTFCVFRRAHWGIRAMVRTLRTYKLKHQLRTVRQLISRWAPAGEENPHLDNYIQFVATWLGVGPDQVIDPMDYTIGYGLVESMTHFENGVQPYTRETIDFGLELAGVRVPGRFPDIPEAIA